jgi:nucleoside phosphorylase
LFFNHWNFDLEYGLESASARLALFELCTLCLWCNCQSDAWQSEHSYLENKLKMENSNIGQGASSDVLLICALKDEYNQVLNVRDGLVEPGWTERIGPDGWIVADAVYETKSSPLRVTATWADHMGREQAQAVASRLISEEPAKCIAMSGICGGRRGKLELGDVIFADRLWSYDAGKLVVEDGKDKFQGDMFQYRLTPVWAQRMQHVSLSSDSEWFSLRPKLPLENQEDWVLMRLLEGITPSDHSEFSSACPDWTKVIERLWDREWVEKPCVLSLTGRERAERLKLLHPEGLPEPNAFQVHVAPMATGAAVVEDAGIFPRLASSMRKVLGIDMESSALGALGEVHGLPVVIAKAVSDYGDPYKDDRYRHFSARASAEYLVKLLRDSADLIPGFGAEISDPTVQSQSGNDAIPRDLIKTLADEYPDARDARAVWVRAGGRPGDVEANPRPQDLWQRLWGKSIQGASVTPKSLLTVALEDLPGNTVFLEQLTLLNT